MIPVRAPLRSSSALVPVVVPWTTVAMSAKSGISPATPATKPRDWSSSVEGVLAVVTRPLRRSSAKMSVKVPPTSTPTTWEGPGDAAIQSVSVT